MLAIFKKELRSYFTSLVGYVFLFFFLFTTAIMFFIYNVFSGNPNYALTLANTSILFLILIPILTMRLFSEEMRQKTDQLIFSSPISIWKIVVGKFLGSYALFAIGMLITMVFPFVISRYGEIPLSSTIGSIVGYFFLVGCLISVGMFISSLTENQIISAVATFAVIFLFYIMDSIAQTMPSDRASSIVFIGFIILLVSFMLYNSTKNAVFGIIFATICISIMMGLYFYNSLLFDNVIYKVLVWFSLLSRFMNFSTGVFDLADIIYYFTFSFAFIYLTINVIEKRRWK